MRIPLFVLFFIVGCSSAKRDVVAVEPPPAAAEQCAEKQFVACVTGEDCARSRGKLVRAHACFDHAADACSALGCKHGCNITGNGIGESNDVHCAINDASSSHLWKCGGFAGWKCPENMTCKYEDGRAGFDDASGKCVRDAQ